MTETGRCDPGEIDDVLRPACSGAGNGFGSPDIIKGFLAAKLARGLDGAQHRGEVAVGPEMIGFDDGRIAPVGGGKPYATAAGRLDKSQRDRESFFGRLAKSGSSFGRRER